MYSSIAMKTTRKPHIVHKINPIQKENSARKTKAKDNPVRKAKGKGNTVRKPQVKGNTAMKA